MRAADFLSTIGVDTHIRYTDGGYASTQRIVSELAYLGVNQVRDTMYISGTVSMQRYADIAKAGIRFTFNIGAGGAYTTASLGAEVGLVASLNAAVPGSVLAVEGANEIDHWPVSYNGLGGIDGAVALQKALYAQVHGTGALKGVAVDYFTGYGSNGVALGPDPSKVAGLADYDTQHVYPILGRAPGRLTNPVIALPNETVATGAAVYSEAGYSSYGSGPNVVSEDVQAKYTLDLLFDAAKNGVAHTYLYELMDAYKPGSKQGDAGFGLFDSDYNPKPVATAIHNLTQILADPNPSGASAAAPAPTVAGLSAAGSSMVLTKSGGVVDLVVWDEPAIWNAATHSEVAAAVEHVTAQLGATYGSVSIYDPLHGTAPIRTLTNVSSVSLDVTDHPLIVEMRSPVASPALSRLAVNHAPAVRAATVSGDEDHAITGQVGGSDQDGDALTYALVKPVAGLTLNPDGSFRFDPQAGGLNSLAAGTTGTVSFQVTASDGTLTSKVAKETISVTGLDDAPTAVADTVAYVRRGGAALSLAAATLTRNDTDPDRGDTRSLSGVGGTPAHGTVARSGTGLIYTPDASILTLDTGPGSRSLTDAFSYTVQDKTGAQSTAEVSVTLTGQSLGATSTTRLTGGSHLIGVDIAALSNVTLATNGSPGTMATLTGFAHGSDHLELLNGHMFQSTDPASYAGHLGSLMDAANEAASLLTGGAMATAFEQGGSTYLYADHDHSHSFDKGDGLVRLAGATGLSHGSTQAYNFVLAG